MCLMPRAIVTLEYKGRSRQLMVPAGFVCIGRSAECDVVLPFPWIRERHLEVQQDAGWRRVRCAAGDARALLDGRPLNGEWRALPDDAVIELPTPFGDIIRLDFEFKSSLVGGADVLREETPAAPAPLYLPEVEIVEASPLPGGDRLFDPAPATATATATGASHVGSDAGAGGASDRQEKSHAIQILLVSAVAMFVIMCALGFNQWQRSRYAGRVGSDLRFTHTSIAEARDLLKQQRYAEAKGKLDAARAVAARHESMEDYRREIEQVAGRPEVKLGGIGYVLVERQWLPPDTAAAWKTARQRDDPKIDALKQKAEQSLLSNDLAAGQQACDEALALMEAHPVKPHPEAEAIRTLRADINHRAVAVEMTAKGLVAHGDKWVTPKEKFRLEQLARGYVERDGKWVTQAEAFAAEQAAKGLVLHDGKWMTPDEQMTARGLVKFDGKWVEPRERDALAAARDEQRRQAEAKAAAERARLALEGDARRQEAARVEELKSRAYEMSQTYVKQRLKSPQTAQFQAYGAADVSVSYADGWFTVFAVVDAQNSFGATVQTRYLCKLRPRGGMGGAGAAGDAWDAESCYIFDP